MKRLLAVLLLITSCATSATPAPRQTPVVRSLEKAQLIIQLNDEIIQVEYGDNYQFKLPTGSIYNKVYANGIEIPKDADSEYIIPSVTENIIITFNPVYEIILPDTISITSTHGTTVNEHDSVSFVVNKTHKPYTVYSNNQPVEVVNHEFTIEDIQENLVITIVEDSGPDFNQYSNTDLSWWYRPGSVPTIDAGIERLISNFDVLWKVNTNNKIVYLTMDEGYEYQNNTTRILDITKAKQVRITFFITGSYLDHNPELVRRMLDEGHVVANHTDRHLRAPTISTDELTEDIQTLALKYQQAMGQPISSLYRPPEGGYSERSLAVANELGYTTVFWSFAYRDWLVDQQPDPTSSYNTIINQLHPGAILLLHAVSETNVQILGDLIDGIRAQGYTIGVLE